MTSLPIVLSSGVVPTVKIGDGVKVRQVIARKASHAEYIINLKDKLAVPIEKVRKYLRKNPGDQIKTGDVLAVRKSRFGFREEKLISNVTGLIARYERDTGNLVVVVEGDGNTTDIVSPVDGIVTMCDNEKIVLGTERNVYIGRKATGGSVIGEAFIIEDAFREISLYYALDNRAVGKIILGRDFTRDILIKSAGMGVIGIVGTEIRNEDIEYLSQRNMEIPIIEVDDNTIDLAIRWKAKRFYLNSQEKVILFLHA